MSNRSWDINAPAPLPLRWDNSEPWVLHWLLRFPHGVCVPGAHSCNYPHTPLSALLFPVSFPSLLSSISFTFQLNYLHLNSWLRAFLGTPKKTQGYGTGPGTQTFYVSAVVHYQADKEERETIAQLKGYHSCKHS